MDIKLIEYYTLKARCHSADGDKARAILNTNYEQAKQLRSEGQELLKQIQELISGFNVFMEDFEAEPFHEDTDTFLLKEIFHLSDFKEKILFRDWIHSISEKQHARYEIYESELENALAKHDFKGAEEIRQKLHAVNQVKTKLRQVL